MVDWRGFGTEQWRGGGAPAAETARPTAADLPSTEAPAEPPDATAVGEGPTPADGASREATDATPRALVTEAEASFLRERIEQHERSIDRLEQLVGRAQELQLAEQRAHEETRRQLADAQERVVRLLEAPRPEAAAPPAPSVPAEPPPAAGTASEQSAAPGEPRETGSAEAVSRDVRRGLVRLSRWLRG